MQNEDFKRLVKSIQIVQNLCKCRYHFYSGLNFKNVLFSQKWTHNLQLLATYKTIRQNKPFGIKFKKSKGTIPFPFVSQPKPVFFLRGGESNIL